MLMSSTGWAAALGLLVWMKSAEHYPPGTTSRRWAVVMSIGIGLMCLVPALMATLSWVTMTAGGVIVTGAVAATVMAERHRRG